MTEPIRVLHVIDHLDIGGAQQSLSLLLKYMDRKRYPCAVVTLHGEGKYFELFKEWGIPVYSLGKSKANPWLWFRYRKLLKLLRPKIVHTHLVFACLLAGLQGLFDRRIPMISHVRSENQFKYDKPWLKPIHAFFNRRAELVIAVSSQVVSFLEKDESVPSDKVRLITNIVSPPMEKEMLMSKEDVFKICEIPQGAKLLVTAARLDVNKGIQHVIEAISQCIEKYPNLYYVVLGEGPDRGLFEQQIEALQLSKHIRLMGFVDNRKEEEFCVQAVLHCADGFVLPSYFEGFPVSVLEAMAAELPVICTPVSGVDGVFQDEELRLIPFKDSEATKKAICTLLEMDASEKHKQLKKAKKYVERAFYPKVLCQKLSEEYDRIMG